MFRRIHDFLAEWAFESQATLSVLRALTDSSLDQRVSPEGRSAGRLAWHIVQCAPGMAREAGLDVVGPGENDPMPTVAAELATRYAEAAHAISAAIAAQFTDNRLTEEIPMYGETWPRGKALSALIRHEAHHRGQLTVLMRQAGLKVPGVYGPAREEWAAMGLAPLE